MDPSRFSHDESPYERPDSKFRCGRAAGWAAPCARGPNADGSCGGVSECAPRFDGNGYRCRRPACSGGPCEDGPGPDGACGLRRPPCVPRRSLRALRGRATLFAALVAVASLAALTGPGGWPMLERLDLSDPGPISGAHARFTEQGQCDSCHRVEDGTALALLGEAVSGHDMSGACLECHAFDGPPDRPHNVERLPLRGPATLACTDCHSEHGGEDFDIARLTDRQCQGCHRADLTFTSFGDGHPPFGADFPYDTPAAIKFTHVLHLTKHFASEGDKRPPAETCLSCHDIDHAGPNVPVFSFERMCADCHADEIGRKDLLVLSLPEFETSLLALTAEEERAYTAGREAAAVPPAEIFDACGAASEELERLEDLLAQRKAQRRPGGSAFLSAELGALPATGDGAEALEESAPQDGDDFLSVGEDEPGPVEAFLLAIDPEDAESYWRPYRSLIHALTQSGAPVLHRLVEERFGAGAAERLLAGLDPLPLADLACAWAGNEEYEPEGELRERPGWRAEALSVRYRPAGHGDAVLRSWLELAHGIETGADSGADGGPMASEGLEALRRLLFSEKDGPGGCAACHAPVEVSSLERDRPADGVRLAFESRLDWQQRPEVRHHVRYAHGPHINLLGRGSRCTSCHQLKPVAGAADAAQGGASAGTDPAARDFVPITIQQCTSCHKENGVRQDCATCHQYHRTTTFRKRMF